MKISQRLQSVAKYVNDKNVADIGSDHAYLPCYLVKNNLVTKAIAGEVAKGPFLSATSQVKNRGYEGRISVRLGYGLDVIGDDVVDTITICGMGGNLIATILEKGKEKLFKTKRLVLQPNNSARAVRRWLVENSWLIVAEEIFGERGYVYEIIVAEKGKDVPLSKCELLLGPYLMRNKNQFFYKKWFEEKAHINDVLEQLSQCRDSSHVEQKRYFLLDELDCISQALKE